MRFTYTNPMTYLSFNTAYKFLQFVFSHGSRINPGGSVIKNLSSTPGSGRSSGEGNDCPLQYSYLENSMDRGSWWGTAHRVVKSWTGLND